MRTNRLLQVLALVLVMVSLNHYVSAQSPNAPDQGGQRPMCQKQPMCNKPGEFQNAPQAQPPCWLSMLTEEQQKQIKDLHLAHVKEIKPLKDQIREKKAHLRTLQTQDNPDMKAIFALIDEIGVLKTSIAKKAAEHQQAVRKILTEEQRIIFDQCCKRMKKGGQNMGGHRGGPCPMKP